MLLPQVHLFRCEDPDLFVKSSRDGASFGVKREALMTSDVFRGMFAVCDDDLDHHAKDEVSAKPRNESLELDESGETLSVLLHLLHTPPPPPPSQIYPLDYAPSTDSNIPKKSHGLASEYMSGSVIPLPLLDLFYAVVDKYALSESISHSLNEHLLAHASDSPLQVYCKSIELGLYDIASQASRYLISPPVSKYTDEDIRQMPGIAAYHKLVQFQAARIEELKSILLKEELFPHGYGACPAGNHRQQAEGIWEQRRRLLAPWIEADTDIAAEMGVLLPRVESCPTCLKACTAAVDMIAYKTCKVPKRIKW